VSQPLRSCGECLTQPEVYYSRAVRVELANVTFLGSTGIGLLVAECSSAKYGGAFSVSCTGLLTCPETSGLVDYLEVQRAA
jgi:hypothetical protein